MIGAIFTRIVVYSTKTMAIYAGFAVVLLFLLWLYISWLILLLGAQLSFYLQHPEHLRTGQEDIEVTGAMRERLAMSIMWLLGDRFQNGGPRWNVNALAERLMMPGHLLNEVVSMLEAHGLVLTAEDDSVAPARDLGAIRLASIMDAIRHPLPHPWCPQPRPVEAADTILQAADEALHAALGERTLRDLLSADAPENRQV
jgi:membrane protein